MKRINIISATVFMGMLCIFALFFFFLYCDICFSPNILTAKFLIAGLIILIGMIYLTTEFLKVEKIIFEIESIPLSKTDRAVAGVPFAGEGIVEVENYKVLKSPYTQTPCVYFHAIKEELKREAINRWEIIEDIVRFVPFYIRDEKGRLKVNVANLDDDFSGYKIPLRIIGVPDPKNSEIDCELTLRKIIEISQDERNEETLDTMFKSEIPKIEIRMSEYVLKPGTKVFVYGMVSREKNELVLHEAEECPLVISRKSRDQYVQEFYRGENILYFSRILASFGFTAISLFAIYFLNDLFPIDLIKFLIFIIVGNIIILGSLIFTMYNRIVSLKNRALNALSNIDVELKRRADLIPRIVEIVKKYAKHEAEAQRVVAEGRAKIMFSHELKKKDDPVIHSLVAVIENYPDLKASESFQSLMRSLVDTEERIAYSREFYNRSVRKYNTIIKQIPFLFIALLFGFKEMDFITIERGK